MRVTKGGATAELRHLWGLNGVFLSPRPQNDNGGGEEAKDAKNRRDHRHHAIDALVVALTDHKTLMEMTARYKIFVENGRWPKDPLPLPKGLEFAGTLLPDQFRQTVVSHMKKRKVYGALHEETPYGEGVFETVEKIAPTKKLKNEIRDWIETEPDAQGKAAWIADAQIRAVLRAWLASGKTIDPPRNAETGEIIDSARIAHRCYVVRKPVEKTRGKLRETRMDTRQISMDRRSKAFIASCKNGLPVAATKKKLSAGWRKIRRACLAAGKPGCGPEIKTVRIAEIIGSASIKKLQEFKFFRLGSNHHVEVFRNGENKTRGRLVSMFEAARRKSRQEPIVNRKPDLDWSDPDRPDEWSFQAPDGVA